MPAHKALIWGGSDGIGQVNLPDFIDLEHLSLGAREDVLINSSTIAVTKSYVLAARGSTGTVNQIRTINGGAEGSILVLRCTLSTTIIDSTGNIRTQGNFLMDNDSDTMVLLKLSSDNWLELARRNNG
jgi:hypothetical protein